jgi:cytidine deaminase
MDFREVERLDWSARQLARAFDELAVALEQSLRSLSRFAVAAVVRSRSRSRRKW